MGGENNLVVCPEGSLWCGKILTSKSYLVSKLMARIGMTPVRVEIWDSYLQNIQNTLSWCLYFCNLGTLESSVEGNKLSCVFPYGSQPYGIHTMDWWTSNSLMLYWTHLYHKRTLWTLTLVWTLLNCPLSLFQNWFKGHWVLPNKRYISIQIKIMHYPMGHLEVLIPVAPLELYS